MWNVLQGRLHGDSGKGNKKSSLYPLLSTILMENDVKVIKCKSCITYSLVYEENIMIINTTNSECETHQSHL